MWSLQTIADRSSFLTPLKSVAVLLCLVSLSVQDNLVQTYCSDQNTGANNLADTTIYESLGNCKTKCSPNWAYGIVQGQYCWCSNYAPSDQGSIVNCSDKCLGYPYESCGNVANKLYGYLALGPTPSGTQGAGSPSTSTPSVTTPITSQQVKTISGTVVTSFVTIMPTSTTANADKLPGKAKVSSGSIIAIAIAVVIAGIVLLAALIIGFCCWRRKRTSAYPEDPDGNALQRNTSVLSKSGLLGAASVGGSSQEKSSSTVLERRNSKPLVVDQRLNPNALMQHDDTSISSFVSMQDNRDYTRTLNVRNPDPHADQ